MSVPKITFINAKKLPALTQTDIIKHLSEAEDPPARTERKENCVQSKYSAGERSSNTTL